MSNINKGELDSFAVKKLSPKDVTFTSHFFDRLVDPRNGKAISGAELLGFFKRLAKKKNTFMNFIKRYKEFVATDSRYDINIPFVNTANKLIAKTIMRKKDFKTSNPRFRFEAATDVELDLTGYSFISNAAISKSIAKIRSLPLRADDKIRLTKHMISRVKTQYKTQKDAKKRSYAKTAFKKLHNLIDYLENPPSDEEQN